MHLRVQSSHASTNRQVSNGKLSSFGQLSILVNLMFKLDELILRKFYYNLSNKAVLKFKFIEPVQLDVQYVYYGNIAFMK